MKNSLLKLLLTLSAWALVSGASLIDFDEPEEGGIGGTGIQHNTPDEVFEPPEVIDSFEVPEVDINTPDLTPPEIDVPEVTEPVGD
ncbi:MAG: hypothetical protein MI864_09130 [Pseudomonadales bacterium]|nr:hypothetical protein [Pseudomonadales bacterium]